MKKTSLVLILALLAVQAMHISCVTTASHSQRMLKAEAEDGEGDIVSGSNPNPTIPRPDDGTPPVDNDDIEQCGFAVDVNKTAPNCNNVNTLIIIAERELDVLQTTQGLALEQSIALQKAYNFIKTYCVAGVFGVNGGSLLQVSEKSQRFSAVAKTVVPEIQLIETKIMKAFAAGSELLEDSAHCSEEETLAKCTEYLTETNETLVAVTKFYQEITLKIQYVSDRITYLKTW
eukprot:CAMPEP_0176432176 /NCGR_PEP_ID=MMETSP0127-20121128/15238_1 /TAXON_ID=938130 /ORGANISM="Platyophrya macrostoma, Strain WH" /LENGTH=231 /DNA_ID=CAMNT_0017814297 /DNA_START=65 /DNA_END=757 /DNA_ORIENTATION=-